MVDGSGSTRKVVFYSDQSMGEDRIPEDVRERIRHFLCADEIRQYSAHTKQGFDSGINWEGLRLRDNLVAVVLFDVNDACAFGISLEAGENAGLNVYEYVDANNLQLLKNLRVVGKTNVSFS